MKPSFNVERFDPLTFPLTGRRLIEASAGTGKTYNIANLYLRCLLGHGCEPRAVEQILVVTFTRAATDELRGRIRERIVKMLEVLEGGHSKDDFLLALSKTVGDEQARAKAMLRLKHALACMDEASIFTIHSFALRAIQTFVFETGALADVEITETNNPARELLLADLWRQMKLTKNALLASFVANSGFSSKEKFEKYLNKISPDLQVMPAFEISDKNIEEQVNKVEVFNAGLLNGMLKERKKLDAEWKNIVSSMSDDAIKALLKPVVDLPLAGNPDAKSSATNVLKNIKSIFESHELDVNFSGGATGQRLDMLYKSDQHTPVATLIKKLMEHVKRCSTALEQSENSFRAFLVQYIAHQSKSIDLSSMHLDDVVAHINQLLESKDVRAAKRLKAVVTRQYPVCLVDEFQDTDPAQFRMFNNLYKEAEGTGFFMIGDPKQSIYKFRGADIFSYIGVKREVQQLEKQQQHIFSLDTNFRSKTALVAATNKLFEEKSAGQAHEANGGKPVFISKGIYYEPVKSSEESMPNANKGCLLDASGKSEQKIDALVFIGNPANENAPGDGRRNSDKLNKDTLQWKYANDTAQRISRLLDGTTAIKLEKEARHAKAQGKGENGAIRPLCGSDIAVLVRSAREAHAVRQALLLQTPPIGSVYQSQRDSVFGSSIIALDLYHLLCAFDNPRDKKLLKTVSATLLYRGFATDFTDLELIEAEGEAADTRFEQLIDEFESYQREWQAHGVLAALNAFSREHGLMAQFARLPDCDRLATDFRHLGEILQNHELECGSREQLIIWYARQLENDSQVDEDSKRIRLESDESLVKIVTIHVSKGLEYPIVFLPFFFMPWNANPDKEIPVYHPEPDLVARADYLLPKATMAAYMQQEMLAEDMRLLYVAVTRAIFQCFIGISDFTSGKKPQFPSSVWAHLLAIDKTSPTWPELRSALQAHFGIGQFAVAYRELGDAVAIQNQNTERVKTKHELVTKLEIPVLPPSYWVITSYSTLARGIKPRQLAHYDDDSMVEQSDQLAADNIRFTLRGSNRTGDCLHEYFEALALDPTLLGNSTERDYVLANCLRRNGLEKPETLENLPDNEALRNQVLHERRLSIAGWLDEVIQVPLLGGEPDATLSRIFSTQHGLPEMAFNFSIGKSLPVAMTRLNRTLEEAFGISSIHDIGRDKLQGLMTGSIDLLFIHKDKIYILDYKSNSLHRAASTSSTTLRNQTLDAALGFYQPERLQDVMRHEHYDLQSAIYSVAAHRFMQQRSPGSYHFDHGHYQFGGVIYLFLRGMGVKGKEQYGIYFSRPSLKQVNTLDSVLMGEDEPAEVAAHG